MALRLSFYGAAGKVTGSNFLISAGGGSASGGEGVSKILVDCGIEQGSHVATESVYGPFPYDVTSVSALVVTHSHLDHVGRIPKLVKDGFRGRIYMTPPTKDLAELILRDSVGILFDDAQQRGVDPLYGEEDVDRAFAQVKTLEYHIEKEIAPGFSIYLRNTGHILGSCSVRMRDEEGVTVALTGDIGNSPSPLLPNWEAVPDADALVMESVYGNRVHPARRQRVELLRDALKRAITKGGAILIPAFSLERTQLMLYELSNFFQAGDLPKVPVFLDSPLAIKVTGVYEKWGPTYFKPTAEEEMKREKSLFEFPFLTKTLSHEESQKIAETPNPKIIIAGAGMSHGGRIGRWETKYLSDPRTTLFMVGYQAPGSPGRHIQEGARSVHLNGQDVSVRANIELMEGWSAHADRDELLKFAESCLSHPAEASGVGAPRPKVIFTALGEPAAERFLAQRIHDYLGVRAVAADFGQTWEITKTGVTQISK